MRRENTSADSLGATIVSTLAAASSAVAFEWAAYFGFRSVSEPIGQLVYVQLPALIVGGVAVGMFMRHSFVSACWRCAALFALSSLIMTAFYAVVSHPI